MTRDEADRLHRIIEALLFLARSESEADAPESVELDLNRWLPDRLVPWSRHARAADLEAGPGAGGPLAVRVHPELLGQLLDNLIDNAFKYSQPGSPVRVTASREGEAAALVVEDRGCGMEAEDRANAFAPFYRAGATRRRGQPGVGLGLAVASRIAATFGGTLDVRSEPGLGSRFRLLLPPARPRGGNGPAPEAAVARPTPPDRA